MDTDLSRMLPDIETIVSKALEKSPNDRYQSADEMRKALVTFLDSSRARLTAIESAAGVTRIIPSTAANSEFLPTRLDSQHEQPANRWLWIGGAAAAAVLIAVVSLGLPSTNVEPSAAAAVTTPPATAPPADTTASNPAPPNTASTATPAERVAPPPAPVKTTPVTTKSSEVLPPSGDKPVESTAVARDLTAKDMFESSSTDAGAAAPGIRFRMILAGPDDKPIDVDPARDFHTGERIRFAFESNINGYLYVAQQGTSGNWTVLFPNPEIASGRNSVKRFEEYVIPDDNWFKLEGNPGEEQLFVFLSREPLKTLPGFDRPVTTFERTSPTLVAELQSTIASRDLILAKDSAATKGMRATYVVNKAELGKAVTAKFTINHKP